MSDITYTVTADGKDYTATEDVERARIYMDECERLADDGFHVLEPGKLCNLCEARKKAIDEYDKAQTVATLARLGFRTDQMEVR